tara:strand:+ start:414 stop:728 length:315 start_codon:yes stop_codon:yes gene_type:complete
MLVAIFYGGHYGLITSKKPNRRLNKMRYIYLVEGFTYKKELIKRLDICSSFAKAELIAKDFVSEGGQYIHGYDAYHVRDVKDPNSLVKYLGSQLRATITKIIVN